MKVVRCAIYTRKSSDEGLEQDFNSLDAQREACAAYVLSQASEGWQLSPEIYDDGGVSGGTLERPALQRLLADVAAGRIDIIVVYKVDRLTRSLLDFAKLVEALDKANTSFVSITQSFNTTTSMGRLTLNMLLSFAQFEREVTAERIRDKLAASKAKGMWMGGTPPLGYRPDGRSLAIVPEHAAIVRDIYARYLKLGSVRLLTEQLAGEGILVPERQYGSGRTFGGVRFTRGQLYFILRNATYAGKIVHKDKVYPGQHAPIIDDKTWDQVQQRLADNTQGQTRVRSPHRSLLAGLIFDSAGEPMLASHASKKPVRYRYYTSRSLQTGSSDQGLRLPASEIEQAVKEHVAQLFGDPLALAAKLGIEITPARLQALNARCAELAAAVRSRGGGLVRELIHRVRAGEDTLTVDISTAGIAAELGVALPDDASPSLMLSVGYRLTRTGQALRLVQDGGMPLRGDTNPQLVSLIVQARKWWGLLSEGTMDTTQLAAQLGVTSTYLTRVVRIAFLVPAITEAILEGRAHSGLTAATLRNAGSLPRRWEDQAAIFLPKTFSPPVGLTSKRD